MPEFGFPVPQKGVPFPDHPGSGCGSSSDNPGGIAAIRRWQVGKALVATGDRSLMSLDEGSIPAGMRPESSEGALDPRGLRSCLAATPG